MSGGDLASMAKRGGARNVRRGITLAKLKELLAKHSNSGAHLHCPECQGEFGADPSDYWYMADSDVFTCDGMGEHPETLMVLARVRSRLEVLR